MVRPNELNALPKEVLEPIFTVAQVAEFLQMATPGVRRLIAMGRLKIIRLGVHIRIRKDDLLEVLTPSPYSPDPARDCRRKGYQPRGRPRKVEPAKRGRPRKAAPAAPEAPPLGSPPAGEEASR